MTEAATTIACTTSGPLIWKQDGIRAWRILSVDRVYTIAQGLPSGSDPDAPQMWQAVVRHVDGSPGSLLESAWLATRREACHWISDRMGLDHATMHLFEDV